MNANAIGGPVYRTAMVRGVEGDGDLTGPAQGSKQSRRITTDDENRAGVARAEGEPGRIMWMDDRADST